jgi:hypothetical protein
MSTPFWRRLLALTLLVPALLAVGEGLHHHETLAALMSSGPAAAITPQAISSHDPHSPASHWHAAVIVHEDACVACSVQRATGTPSVGGFEAPLEISLASHANTASIRVSFARLALGSRGPPFLL